MNKMPFPLFGVNCRLHFIFINYLFLNLGLNRARLSWQKSCVTMVQMLRIIREAQDFIKPNRGMVE